MGKAHGQERKEKVLRTLTTLTFQVTHQYISLGNSSLELPREISDKTLQFYGEYGLFDNTTILLNAPIKFVKAGEMQETTGTIEEGSLSGFGNIEVAVKHKVVDNDLKVALQANFVFPTASYDSGTGLRTGYDAFGFVPGVTVGGSSDNFFAYAYLNTGIYTNDYSSNMKTGFELGWKPVKPLWIIGVFDVLQSFDNGSRIDDINNLQTGLYVNNQEYVAYGLKFAFEIVEETLGVQVAGFGAASGNFVAKSPSLNIGVYYKF